MIVSKSLNVVPVHFAVIFAIITAILLCLYQHPCQANVNAFPYKPRFVSVRSNIWCPPQLSFLLSIPFESSSHHRQVVQFPENLRETLTILFSFGKIHKCLRTPLKSQHHWEPKNHERWDSVRTNILIRLRTKNLKNTMSYGQTKQNQLL